MSDASDYWKNVWANLGKNRTVNPDEGGTQGSAGPKGDKGDPGNPGVDGSAGPKGDKGDTGDVGAQGSQGPPGVKGDTGTQGQQGIQGLPGTTWKGVWTSATAYAINDLVIWCGTTYIATSVIASGGNPPPQNASWSAFTRAGGRIVRSIYTGVDVSLVNNGVVDVPGLQIVVPAGSPDFIIRAAAEMEATTTAVNGWARMVLLLYDVTAGNVLMKQGWVQGISPLSGQNISGIASIEEAILSQAVSKTYKLSTFCNMASVTPKLKSPGTATSTFTPFLEAVAA